MFRKAFTIFIVVIFFVLCFTAGSLYYVMRDLTYYAERALKPFEENTGFRIGFEDIAWRFSLGIGVTIKNLKITHIASSTTVLESNKNYILLRLFPLLRKQIVVSKIIIDTPRLYMFRNQDGTWPFALFLPAGLSENAGTGLSWFPFSITMRRCIINDGDLEFRDYQRNAFTHFQKLNLDIAQPLLLEPYRLSCSAEMKSGIESGQISYTGTIKHGPLTGQSSGFQAQGVIALQKVALASLMPYVKQWQPNTAPEGLIDAHLECSLASDSSFNARGWLQSEALKLPAGIETPFTIKKALVKVDAVGGRDAVHIKNCEITLPGIVITGELSATGLPQAPVIDAHLRAHSVTWKAVKHLIPEAVRKRYLPDYINNLQDATIGIKALHVKSCLSASQPLTLELCNGNGEISNVIVSINNTLPQLKVASGSFAFTKDTLTLTNIAAQWFPHDAHVINATITQPFASYSLDVRVQTTAPSDALVSALAYFAPGFAEKLFSPDSGIIETATQIRYPIAAARQAEISSAIDLTQLNYSLGNFIGKSSGLHNMATIKTAFSPGTLPAAVDVSYALDNNSFSLSGTLQDWKAPVFTGDYQLQDMDVTSLGLLFMPSDITLQGTLNGKGTITVPSSHQSALPDIQGTIDASRLEMRKTGDTLPLLFVNVKGLFNGDKLHINQATGSFGRTTAGCSGDFYYGDTPLGQFKADVSWLDLDDFIETVIKLKKSFNAPRGSSATQPVSASGEKPFFRRFVLDAPSTVKNGKFMSWHFTDGTTHITIKDGVMNYGNINLHAYQGILNGAVIHDFSQPGTYRLTFLPDANGIQFEEFLPELQAKKVIAGKINLDGMFTSLFRKGEEVVPNMEGNFKISMKNAKLGKFTVISKILSLLSFTEMVKLHIPNLLSRGMPLEAVDGRFVMAQGVAHTDDLFMKSPAMNLTAVGDLNFARKEINLIVGVQPLETVGKLLGSIPIAGKILTGENKSITVSYFQVSGPYADASVKPVPVESLSHGVKALINRFYKLPQEILNTGRKQDQGS